MDIIEWIKILLPIITSGTISIVGINISYSVAKKAAVDSAESIKIAKENQDFVKKHKEKIQTSMLIQNQHATSQLLSGLMEIYNCFGIYYEKGIPIRRGVGVAVVSLSTLEEFILKVKTIVEIMNTMNIYDLETENYRLDRGAFELLFNLQKNNKNCLKIIQNIYLEIEQNILEPKKAYNSKLILSVKERKSIQYEISKLTGFYEDFLNLLKIHFNVDDKSFEERYMNVSIDEKIKFN